MIKITYFGKILIFSIQRINWNTKTKNYSEIFFDLNLDMFDFMDKERMNDCINIKYQLYAILNHSWNLNEEIFILSLKTVKKKNGLNLMMVISKR